MSIVLAADAATLQKLTIYSCALIVAGVFGIVYGTGRKKLFRQLGKKLNLKYGTISAGILDDEGLELQGKIGRHEVSIVFDKSSRGSRTVKYTKRSYKGFISVRVETLNRKDDRFSIRRPGAVLEWISHVASLDIQIGNEEFDKLFVVNSSSEAFVQQLFDHDLCADFVNNASTFQYARVAYEFGYVEFREEGRMNTRAHMERLHEIVLFMVHVAERIDAMKRY